MDAELTDVITVVPLADFCTPKRKGGYGRRKIDAAKLMACSPANITKAMEKKRQIYLQFNAEGKYLDWFEVRGNLIVEDKLIAQAPVH